MVEMPMKADSDADEAEDIHDGTGDYLSCSSAVAPGEPSGAQNPKKGNSDRQDCHDVGTGAQRLRVLPWGENCHGTCCRGSRLLGSGAVKEQWCRRGALSGSQTFEPGRVLYQTGPSFCTEEEAGYWGVSMARLTPFGVSRLNIWAEATVG